MPPAASGRQSASREIVMRRATLLLSASLFTLAASAASAETPAPHNLILFVPDGLRALKWAPEGARAVPGSDEQGVNLKIPHSMSPASTTTSYSALAPGHY